jgi:Zn-finger protein
MLKNHFWRLVFCIDAKPAGSMLIICPTAELAISRGAQSIQKEMGKSIEVMSCSNIFWSHEEENNFFQIIDQQGVVDLLHAPLS